MTIDIFLWWVGCVWVVISSVFGMSVIAALVVDKVMHLNKHTWECAQWIAHKRREKKRQGD